MSDTFKFLGSAEIRHLNIRKEGGDDDAELAVDIKLTGTAPVAMADYFDTALRAFLWDETGEPRILLLAPLKYQNEVRNLDAKIAGQRFTGVKARKFELSPLPNWQVDLTMTLSVHPDRGAQVSLLAEHVMDSVFMTVEPQPDLGLEDTRDKAA